LVYFDLVALFPFLSLYFEINVALPAALSSCIAGDRMKYNFYPHSLRMVQVVFILRQNKNVWERREEIKIAFPEKLRAD
jgi:hypothetical protein